MKKNIGLVLLGAGLVLLTGYLRHIIQTPPERPENNPQQAIKLAGEYLQKQIQSSGKFIYWKDLSPERRMRNKYNILRHMGSLYSLKMLEDYKAGSIDKALIKKSLLWVKSNTFGPLKNGTIGVWSSEAISGKKGMPEQVKLGAAGLVLVGFCGFYDLIKDEVPLSELEGIGDFVIFMQNPDGGFVSKYNKETGKDRSWVSLYYPGEAAFGLVELYKLTKKQKYLDSAIKAMDFLHNSRKDQTVAQVPADHWALIATDKILKAKPDIDQAIRTRLLDHGEKVVKSILLSRIVSHELDVLIGGFHKFGNTTPTSTRVEGLTAIYTHIRDQKLQAMTKDAIKGAITFLLRAQVVNGQFAGALSRSVIKLDGEGKAASKHNRRRNEVRIDYVQHALSAFIEAEKIK